jgi:transcriptional regulator with GAF, ATPase, and Fis domain
MEVLVIVEKDVEKRVDLESKVTSIGRAPENDIQIGDPLASRFHCQIERTDDGFKLVDLESQNGTCVNGRKVNQKRLGEGDTVEIGSVRISLEMEQKKDAQAIRPLRRKRLRKAPKRRRPRIVQADVNLDEQLAGVLQDIQKSLGEDGLRQAEGIFQDFLEDDEGGRLHALQAHRTKLERLVEVNKAINSELDKKKLLNMILDNAVTLTNAERGFIVLNAEEGLRFEVARNFDKESVKKPAFKISHSIAEEVASTGEPVLSSDAQRDGRLREYMSVSDLRLRSVVCVPLRIKKKTIGVLYMDNRFKQGVFTPEDLKILESFADQAAIAIENARLLEENIDKQDELRQAKDKVEKLNELLSKKVEDQQVELVQTRENLEQSQKELRLKFNYDNIIGTSKPMRAIFRLLDRITESDVSVLIQGRSGTGKELVARAIHFNGPRKKASFVSVNCAAISDTLLESELFGHVRGAFTGAISNKKGLFEIADRGTLFLDEIGEMSPAMQKKLLRALQEGEVRPVGGKETRKVDVRILSASNTDLKMLVEQNRFREDLFYRLNVVAVNLPDLKERKEDIQLLIEHFLTVLAAETKREKLTLSREALRLLVNYPWPGNVRELENEMRRVHALSEGEILPESLSENVRKGQSRGLLDVDFNRPLKEVVRESTERIESEVIGKALAQTGWKKTETARLLGISRPTLDAKISQYGLSKSD